jgi:hypothetical protein
MCTRSECELHAGRWVQLRTPWGQHRGIIERVTENSAIILSPRQFAPVHLATDVTQEEMQRLDVVHAWGGFGGGYPGGGYPRRGYGGGYPARGYGAPGFGWTRWAVAFLSIYLLWGLLLW